MKVKATIRVQCEIPLRNLQVGDWASESEMEKRIRRSRAFKNLEESYYKFFDNRCEVIHMGNKPLVTKILISVVRDEAADG